MGEICGLLTLGSTRVLAARYVGCHPNTLRNTARRNPEFAEADAQGFVKVEMAGTPTGSLDCLIGLP